MIMQGKSVAKPTVTGANRVSEEAFPGACVMIRLVAFSTAGAVALLAAAAVAAQTSPDRGGGMQGPQTLEAMQARQEMMFERLDADHDGAITAAELSGLSQMMPRGAGRMRAMIAGADANNDARISKEELMAAGAARFQQMDRNGDGVVSPDERPQAQQAPAAAPAMPMPENPNPADPSQWPGGVPTGG
jgi:hypothetical protein